MIVDKTGNMKFWLAKAVCLLHFAANAAEVSSEDAVLAARGWAKSGAALGGAPAVEAFKRGAQTVTTNCAKKLLDEYRESAK